MHHHILLALILRWLHCLLYTFNSNHRAETWHEGIFVTAVTCECGKCWYVDTELFDYFYNTKFESGNQTGIVKEIKDESWRRSN